jgi:hypothetical protein
VPASISPSAADNRCAASEAQTCCKDCGLPERPHLPATPGGCEQVGTSTLRWTGEEQQA